MLAMGLYIDAHGQVLRPKSTNSSTGGVSSTVLKVDATSNKSASQLSSKVKYTAEDSIRFDRANNVVYLYGKARIISEDVELDADYIRLDQKRDLVFAKGYHDPITNRYKGRPILKQGQEQPITTDSLMFNFKTKRGKSFGTFTSVEQGFLQAKQFKKNEYGEGFFKNGIYSTCDLPHPHFGIHITRGIVTEKKQVVAGPLFLSVEDVPTPLGLPFGFFPGDNRRRSGIIFPNPVEDASRGFMLRDLGYYVNISDYWDFKIIGSVYSKGTFISEADTRYEKRYKHSGNLKLIYSWTYPDNDSEPKNKVEGMPGYIPTKDFNFKWNHSQKPEANPGTTFSASVDVGTSSYNRNTAGGATYDMSQITKNTMNSSIAYGKTIGIFNFTAALRHSQDIQKRKIALQLPEFTLGMNSINPFGKNFRSGGDKWYQKINLRYTMNGINSIDTYESLLFKPSTLRQFKTGMQHNIPVNLPLTVFKYFNLNTNFDYTENWYTQLVHKRFVGAANPNDSKIVTDTIPGLLARSYAYSLGTNVTTKLYGMVNFKKGNIVAIRHVATPLIGFTYNPDFGDKRYGFYRDVHGVPPELSRFNQRYTIFENGPYSPPSEGRRASLNFSLENSLELKRKAKVKQDTTSAPRDASKAFEKFPLLQSLRFDGYYNFAIDSFQLSNINLSARNSFFKQKINLNVTAVLDPYQYNDNGKRINSYAFSKGNLGRLTSVNVALDLNLNSNAFKKEGEKKKPATEMMTPQQADQLSRISRDLNAFVDFNIPWNLTARYNLQYARSGQNSSIVAHSVNFNGDVNVTPKWKIGFSQVGYDFINHKPLLPVFTIYRDLHCWDMSFNWVPQGDYRSYSVELKVKASVLQDLKLSKRRNYSNYSI